MKILNFSCIIGSNKREGGRRSPKNARKTSTIQRAKQTEIGL